MRTRNLTPKRIAIDIAGFTCLLLVPLVGWLPGPGGIPLLIAGLGLLSIHNDWAKRLLHYVRMRSESLRDIFFPDNRLVQWAWDLFVVLLIILGTLISIYAENRFIKAGSVAFYAIASTTFMFNRHRLKWLELKLKRNKL